MLPRGWLRRRDRSEMAVGPHLDHLLGGAQDGRDGRDGSTIGSPASALSHSAPRSFARVSFLLVIAPMISTAAWRIR